MGKGGDFERVIAKKLTVWLTGKEKPYMYWRMPASGGLATIHSECGELSGDIRSLHKDADFLTDTFSIECKNGYPKADFWHLFKSVKNFDLRNFWEQCVNDSQRASKLPMLIYRKKGKKIIIGIREKDRSSLNLTCLPTLIINFCMGDLPVAAFYDFESFWKNISIEDIKKLK
jgi:hypothetical protein